MVLPEIEFREVKRDLYPWRPNAGEQDLGAMALVTTFQPSVPAAGPGDAPCPRDRVVLDVLVVDDSRLQRRILTAQLKALGYAVREAESGERALEACAEAPPDIVISDWMMPGMDGPQFCRRFRAMDRQSYGYFVLLTSKSDRGEIAEGFDAGADDFLTKPVQKEELRARLAAGTRVLSMERELVEKNALLSDTLAELQGLYDTLDHDLSQARELQQSLVKERFRRFGQGEVSLLLRPSGHVGGDLVGFFPIDATCLALFALDVSGHGVASALMTARLSGYLNTDSPQLNVAIDEDGAGRPCPCPPAEVAARLNAIILEELATDSYFTLVFAEIDLATGAVRLVQAGHPHPVIQRADGRLERIGQGGMPVGLFREAAFEEVRAQLEPGDRLLITSDGITECENAAGEMLGEDGLEAAIARGEGLRGPALLDALTRALAHHAGREDFGDDVSAVLFEYDGPNGG